MKLVKSWEVLGLFNQRVLEEIAAQHNLRSLVSKVILSIEILSLIIIFCLLIKGSAAEP